MESEHVRPIESISSTPLRSYLRSDEMKGREVYQFVVKGHLDSEWSDWFDGLTITLVDNGETILSGPIVDQTALHGVLIKIRDLGLPLLSLTRIEPEKEYESNFLMHTEEEGRGG
jgi:hypothetical protein